MKSKKGILVGAIATIALCVSIVTGATFALFQTSSGTDIVVKTAKVNVAATPSNVQTYSLNENGDVVSTEKVGEFTNGGTAKINAKEGTITLDRISAGDKVTFDITVKNNSNIAVKYRTMLRTYGPNPAVLSNKTALLMLALDVETQVNDEPAQKYQGWTYESDWEELGVDDQDKTLKTVHVSIALPADANGKDLMDASATIKYNVEAVQGNAPTTNVPENETRIYNEFDLRVLAASVNSGNTYEGKTVKVMNAIYGSNEPLEPIGDQDHPFKGTFEPGASVVGNVILSNLTFARQFILGKTTYYSGLFGSLGDGAVVRNINFSNVTVKSTADNVDQLRFYCNLAGVLAGSTSGNVTIKDINVNSANVYGYGKVGGLIGMNHSGASLKLTNVKVWAANLYGAYNIGGVVGLSSSAAPTVSNVRVSKKYTIDKIVQTLKSEDDNSGKVAFVDVDTTLKDDPEKSVNGRFFKYRGEDGKYYYYVIQANLYTVKVKGYEDSQLADGNYVGDDAIVDTSNIINGVETTEFGNIVYKSEE